MIGRRHTWGLVLAATLIASAGACRDGGHRSRPTDKVAPSSSAGPAAPTGPGSGHPTAHPTPPPDPTAPWRPPPPGMERYRKGHCWPSVHLVDRKALLRRLGRPNPVPKDRVSRVRAAVARVAPTGWTVTALGNALRVTRTAPVAFTSVSGSTPPGPFYNYTYLVPYRITLYLQPRLTPAERKTYGARMVARYRRLLRIASTATQGTMSGTCFLPATSARVVAEYQRLARRVHLLPTLFDARHSVVIDRTVDNTYLAFSSNRQLAECLRVERAVAALFHAYAATPGARKAGLERRPAVLPPRARLSPVEMHDFDLVWRSLQHKTGLAPQAVLRQLVGSGPKTRALRATLIPRAEVRLVPGAGTGTDQTRVQGLPYQALTRAVAAARYELAPCAEAGLAQGRRVQGRLVVGLVIDEKGHISQATPTRASPSWRPVLPCALRVMKTLGLPRPKGGRASATLVLEAKVELRPAVSDAPIAGFNLFR